MTRDGLRPWGHRARNLTLVGAAIWGVWAVVNAVTVVLDAVLGLDLPTAVTWIVGVPGAAGVTLFLLAGCAWLAAEVGAGMREPR